MSRHDCHRCDWRGDDEHPLSEHVADSGHPACVICARSLHHDEQQTCLPCLGRVRADLADVVYTYGQLPAELARLKSGSDMSATATGSDENPMPGGDVLALLAGGSEGRSEDGTTYRVSDPPSVAYALASWEDDWRSVRREPAASGPATVSAAAAYLGARMGWAAGNHPAFDEFARDVRRLRSRLLRTTAQDDTPETGAPCFGCSEPLERGWTDEGLADHWFCRRCHRVYSDAEYWLAVRAKLEAS